MLITNKAMKDNTLSGSELNWIKDFVFRILVILFLCPLAILINIITSYKIWILISLFFTIIIALLTTIQKVHTRYTVTLESETNDIFSSEKSRLYLIRCITSSLILRIIIILAVFLICNIIDTDNIAIYSSTLPAILGELLDKYFLNMDSGGSGLPGGNSGSNHGIRGGGPNYPDNPDNNLLGNNPDTTTDDRMELNDSTVFLPRVVANSNIDEEMKAKLPPFTKDIAANTSSLISEENRDYVSLSTETVNVQPSQPTANENPSTITANTQSSQPNVAQSVASHIGNSLQRTLGLFDSRGMNRGVPAQYTAPHFIPRLDQPPLISTVPLERVFFTVVCMPEQWSSDVPFRDYRPEIQPYNYNLDITGLDNGYSSIVEYVHRSNNSFLPVNSSITPEQWNVGTYFIVTHKEFTGVIRYPYIIEYFNNMTYKSYTCASDIPDAASNLLNLIVDMHDIRREGDNWFVLLRSGMSHHDCRLDRLNADKLVSFGNKVNKFQPSIIQILLMKKELSDVKFVLHPDSQGASISSQHDLIVSTSKNQAIRSIERSARRLNACTGVVGHLEGRSDKFLTLITRE